MILRKLYILCVIAIMASSAAQGMSAADIVRRAQTASLRVSYRGSKAACITVDGHPVCSQMQVVHLKPDMTRTQYFSPKVLAGVTVIRRGGKVWKYASSRKAWEQIHSAESLPPRGDPGVALSNYTVRLAASQKILGRDAYVVVAKPKRAGESAMRLWIDKQSFLTLKNQVEQPSGEVVSSTSFTKIVLNPQDVTPLAFAVPTGAKSCTAMDHPDFAVAKPRYLPEGYKMVGQCCEKVSGRPCVHLQFSNGVNTISLFERRASSDVKAPGVQKRIPGVMTWTHDKMLFTLIGDLPHGELHRISDSTK